MRSAAGEPGGIWGASAVSVVPFSSGNSARARSVARRGAASRGSQSSSMNPKRSPEAGTARSTRNTDTVIITASGRRSTARASRSQKSGAPALRARRRRRRTGRRLRRRPKSASSAGWTTSAATPARQTTATAPAPSERWKGVGKNSSAQRDSVTTVTETATVRPAERTVARTASGTSRPRSSSSRKRLTMIRL